jgi:hypothetical protein
VEYQNATLQTIRIIGLQFSLENSEMANQVAIVVKILCGSFFFF